MTPSLWSSESRTLWSDKKVSFSWKYKRKREEGQNAVERECQSKKQPSPHGVVVVVEQQSLRDVGNCIFPDFERHVAD